MAVLAVTGEQIDIHFSPGERLWLSRDQLTVPLAAVRQVACVDQPLRLARGARRGLAVSGFLKIGVWGVFGGPRQLVSARRGEPGLHLTLDRSAANTEFDEIVLSDPAAPRLVEAIRHATAGRS
ncbi:hypothetical protein [Micromonospora narathiwatensis]|uniref:PH domain-containing protein n=1 Tax=Micromonospora narathiwatensis TaxID=299146 RepID=A0A1A8ZK98_9ACTN|nr:hypothetical protein [Micromonospora narathiwatensis]SBT44258.1 hypothetical protein GA0070621_2018 [Micromonospora narathiwatensis]